MPRDWASSEEVANNQADIVPNQVTILNNQADIVPNKLNIFNNHADIVPNKLNIFNNQADIVPNQVNILNIVPNQASCGQTDYINHHNNSRINYIHILLYL